jgi:hypothetical protein
MEVNQANLQILKPVAVRSGAQMEFKFQVFNDNDDTARMVRLIVLLPVDVRVTDVFVEEVKVGFGGYQKVTGNCAEDKKNQCAVYWNSSVSVIRAGGDLKKYHDSNVQIDLAYLDVKETAEVRIVTTSASHIDGKKKFGVFVYGSVPDPDPDSNFKSAVC